MTEYIGLYADKELTNPFPRKVIDGQSSWIIDFDRFEAGQEKTFRFFLENATINTIENLKISIAPLKKRGVEVEIINGKRHRLLMNDIHEFYVRWSIDTNADVGRCRASVSISGEVV